MIEIHIEITDGDDLDNFVDATIDIESSEESSDIKLDPSKILPDVLEALRKMLNEKKDVNYTVCE
jgi:hypothetical protein